MKSDGVARASRGGDRLIWRPERGEELTGRLLYGGGDRRQGRDGGKSEQGSPAGSEWLGSKYSAAR
jgi:hypothetical protein